MSTTQTRNNLPRSQKPSTYKIEELTEDGEWNSFWKVVDMPKTAGKEFEKYRAAKVKHRLVEIVDGEKKVVMTNRGEE